MHTAVELHSVAVTAFVWEHFVPRSLKYGPIASTQQVDGYTHIDAFIRRVHTRMWGARVNLRTEAAAASHVKCYSSFTHYCLRWYNRSGIWVCLINYCVVEGGEEGRKSSEKCGNGKPSAFGRFQHKEPPVFQRDTCWKAELHIRAAAVSIFQRFDSPGIQIGQLHLRYDTTSDKSDTDSVRRHRPCRLHP